LTSTWDPHNPAREQKRRWQIDGWPSISNVANLGRRAVVNHRERIAHISAILAILAVADFFTGYNSTKAPTSVPPGR
jgi:hypothetical protein